MKSKIAERILKETPQHIKDRAKKYAEELIRNNTSLSQQDDYEFNLKQHWKEDNNNSRQSSWDDKPMGGFKDW